MIPEYKLGWMAGVLDQKGIIVRKQNKSRATPQLVLMVESTKVGLIRELAHLTGGRPEPREGREAKEWMQRGCSEHCPEAHIEHQGPGPRFMPPVSRWTVTGAAMAIVLWNVLPFMVTDREMEHAMTEALDNLVTSGRGVGMVRSSVQRMEELGWVIPPQIAGRISAPVSEDAARRHEKDSVPA